MPTVTIDPNYFSPRDMLMLRLSILIGGVLISLFMIGDLQMVPEELVDAYVTNRAFVQLPIVFALLASSFHRRFLQFSQVACFLAILGLVYTNYYFIHVSWQLAAFSFPYEGTFLYAFFGFFVFGMTFRYALCLMLLSTAGFICLMLLDSVYGDRTFMNVGFVAGSLFIGAIGRHRLDQLLGALKSANEQLITLSTTDGLTGLSNRRAFMGESERLFALLRRSGQLMSVFMIDLDHFKKFNDSYGHQEGDRAIRCQADILRAVFKRETDILGRYGGEEFIVVAPGDGKNDFERQAAQILAQWQALAMPNEDSPSGQSLSCSIGICHGLPTDYGSLENMIKAADEALYSAKEKGRGTFVVAEPARPI
ncbi:diguanylate cyclase (GGDEF) domain-containing protein [Marinobacter sp. LV10R510-11A]|uniref:GGDEF domain-containing protein n=1 Tax=Marinobacter sp. LV10R510-11A TaxID=1415568 RepID=UPI000BB9487A|nr:GGDEF domain-containing protein [Marinobacter sp. LV10R510-11A]SOB78181.1 diguanylate cyclase (GGDEF) domain-containing protein [Marinobacter sp. LV10R510-11A]